jgi:hypothetical protein
VCVESVFLSLSGCCLEPVVMAIILPTVGIIGLGETILEYIRTFYEHHVLYLFRTF